MRNRLQTEVHATAMEAGDYLPLELISDVLSRLPAKSIGRFRCVCKDWQSLLSEPNFKDLSYRYMIEGSCNGLLLLLDTKFDELSIINSITRASRKLPALPPNFPNYRPFGFRAGTFGFRALYRTYGFGYNSSIDDYIVAVIDQNRTGHSVYVLKRNCWKMVNNRPFAFDTGFGSCIIVNEAIHMLGYRISDKSRIICALDLASERFREVEQPEGLKEQHAYLLNVSVLGGCLCLASRPCNTGIANTDIWVMKEYGVSKSWSKYYTFTSDRFALFKPLCLWGGDEFMVGVTDGKVTLCSLNKPQTIPVFAERCPLLVHHCTCWTFTDSLFSPNEV